MASSRVHADFVNALQHLANAREAFKDLADGGHRSIFSAVFLDKNLFPSKLAIVPSQELVNKDVFVKNAASRSHPENPTSAHPRFQWWSWLDNYLVRFKIKEGDLELLPQ